MGFSGVGVDPDGSWGSGELCGPVGFLATPAVVSREYLR